MGVVEIVFDIIAPICLFNALLLCSTSLNRFMSKKKGQKYVADTDTSHRVLRFQLPSLFFQGYQSISRRPHYSRWSKAGAIKSGELEM